MNVSLWPVGLQHDLPAHQHCLRRHLAWISRDSASRHRRHVGGQHTRCLAHTQQAVKPAVADVAPPSDPPSSTNGVQNGTVQPSTAYPFTEIENKWKHHWLQNKTFKTPDIASLDTSKPKFYALDMCVLLVLLALPAAKSGLTLNFQLHHLHCLQHVPTG